MIGLPWWTRMLVDAAGACAVHVVPVDDLREHDEERCWCCPVRDDEAPVWVHNSADGREAFERGERAPS